MTLRVGIGNDDFIATNGESCGDMNGDGGFSDTTFFIDERDNFHSVLSTNIRGRFPKNGQNSFCQNTHKKWIHT